LLIESETPASSTGSDGRRCDSEAASQKVCGSQMRVGAAANLTAPSVSGARTMPIMPGASPVMGVAAGVGEGVGVGEAAGVTTSRAVAPVK
jgi:hypothetical protein